MKLVTAEQMRLVDRETIDHHGIPGPELMENAGRGIAEAMIASVVNASMHDKVTVFCGKGNNGGDGYVVARYLRHADIDTKIFFLGPTDKLSPDARLNFDRARSMGLDMVELTSSANLPERLECDCIVDAVFGTGFTGAPRGLASDVIAYINRQPQCVVAVDLPSGLDADNGRHQGPVVKADYTFTLALPKYGLYLSPGRELAGLVATIPIGVPPSVVDSFELNTELITHEMLRDLSLIHI